MASTHRHRVIGAPLGPGSLLWETAGDPRSLLPGTAAGLLQLMLPGLGAGVTDHSDFFDDPFDRIFRSIPAIWGSIFAADEDEGAVRGRWIRDRHTDIAGTDHHGHRYHALDPEVFWWAHATFTWEMFRARELFFPFPLSSARQEQLYAETVTWYRRYGVMPDVVRRRFGFRWTHVDRMRFAGLCLGLKAATPAIERGALDGLWPEGTPHLDVRDRTRVVIAGPNPRQRRRTRGAGRTERVRPS